MKLKRLTSLLLSAVLIFSLASCQSASITEFEQYLNDGDYSAALELYESELLGQKSQEDADQVLESLIDSLKKSYIDEKEDYDTVSEALRKLKEYSSVTGLVSSTLSDINKLQESREAYTKAEELVKSNDYTDAITELQKVASDDSNYDKAQTMLEQVQSNYRSTVLDICKGYVESGDYEAAITAIHDAIYVLPDDDQLSKLLTEYENAFVQQALNKAAEQAKQGDYTGAVQTLELASDTVDSEQFDEKIAEYEGYKPHKLSELKVVDSENLKQHEDAVQDTYGNIYNYSDQLQSYSKGSTGYVIYNANREYTKFSGTLACGEDTGRETTGVIEIFADDKLIYTSSTISRTTAPIVFEVDISNASLIKVKCTTINSSYFYCLIGNATVSK